MNSILFIDNSELLKKIFTRLFVNKGFHFFTGSSIKDLKKTLKDTGVDLIITSLELELGSGEEIIDYVNSRFPDIPIIVLSSNDGVKLRKKLFSMGIIDFISKKNSEEKLIKYIDRLIKDDGVYQELRNIKIAILEDNELDFKIIKKIFEIHEITNIDYFKYAEDLLKTEKEYSLYLIDLVLIDSSGEQVIVELREKIQNAVIIAISGVDHYKAISNVLLSGADDYLVKPLNENIFMARISTNVRNFMLNKQLAEMVVTDGLTGVYNHNYIYERIEVEIQRAKRYSKDLSVVMYDIDHFKSVNDSFGHQAGDEVLEKIAQTLKSSVRSMDIVGRYGGEEFVLILPETPQNGAYLTAERIRKNIESLHFNEKSLRITISGGVVSLTNENALELINKADKLLYKAKANGRNQIML